MKREKFRVWWPDELLFVPPNSDLFVFGWLLYSVSSVDIVVSCVVPSNRILEIFSSPERQEALSRMNRKLPVRLQESSTFSIIGQCTIGETRERSVDALCDCSDNEYPLGGEKCSFRKPMNGNVKTCHGSSREAMPWGSCATWSCGCVKVDDFVESHKKTLMNSGSWIRFHYKTIEAYKKSIWVPVLHHIHQNGQIFSSSDVHIVIYELPEYGRRHLSLSNWASHDNPCFSIKKPKWVKELYKKQSYLDLGLVLLALNCASYFKISMEQETGNNNVSRFVSAIWHLVAVFIATISTAIYILLQFLNMILSYGSTTFLLFLPKMFPYTWKNVHIRSCQFLYWPLHLKGTGFSAQPNIEYAHKSAFKKHFMWSNVLMDVILGTIFCSILLANIESISYCASLTARDMTDNLLRSGCVWLMGVPAGFKLNNELAEFLGMISLNAIQIVSALWFFLSNFLRISIQILAISGVVFGLTVPIALCIDMLKIVTLHVSILHWLISFIYSQQIQALASLWRLFRGQKLNPLRQRLDSYDYTVDQHVLGSLLFTPLLLLLPTTSVFYIFFSSLNIIITFICIVFEIAISVLHATPYTEILLWAMKRRRFPSGIWFRILHPKYRFPDETSSYINSDDRKRNNFICEGSKISISVLCSNFASLGQVITPHYKNIFHGVDPSFGLSLAHGILSGQRFPSALHTRVPPTMPWMRISCRNYWKLCYAAVFSSRL